MKKHNGRRVMGWVTVVAVLLPGSAVAATGVFSGKVTASRAKYLRNAVVSLHRQGLKVTPPRKPARIDQRGKEFIPRVLPVVKGTTVEFHNGEAIEHNVNSPDGETYDLGNWNQGEKRTRTFNTPGAYTQLCKLHPEMIASVVVLDSPFFAVTKKDGSFKIAGVPAGEYTLKVWHERLQAAPITVTVAAGKSANVEVPLSK